MTTVAHSPDEEVTFAGAHSISEVESFVELAGALLINVGTLSEDWAGGMKLAALAANRLGKPWVLDPVGCGATPARTRLCAELLDMRPTVVRGNASEVLALGAAAASRTKGVDSSDSVAAALPVAQALALRHGCVVAISGAVDAVTGGGRTVRVANGSPLLQTVTATGCSVTALIAAFLAVHATEPMAAAVHALAYYGVAAERAAADATVRGPGSFRTALLDELYCLAQSPHLLTDAVKAELEQEQEHGADKQSAETCAAGE